MKPEIKTWLYDIVNAIKEIEDFTSTTLTLEAYQHNLLLQRAVERNITIIGEAMNRIVKNERDFRLEEARKIISTRNKIIHDYEFVSQKILWDIVQVELPKLKILLSSKFDILGGLE